MPGGSASYLGQGAGCLPFLWSPSDTSIKLLSQRSLMFHWPCSADSPLSLSLHLYRSAQLSFSLIIYVSLSSSLPVSPEDISDSDIRQSDMPRQKREREIECERERERDGGGRERERERQRQRISIRTPITQVLPTWFTLRWL